jgi:hypothetical protein
MGNLVLGILDSMESPPPSPLRLIKGTVLQQEGMSMQNGLEFLLAVTEEL